MTNPVKYETVDGFIVTRNYLDRTWTIYTKNKEFLSTVDDGELSSELRELKLELGIG